MTRQATLTFSVIQRGPFNTNETYLVHRLGSVSVWMAEGYWRIKDANGVSESKILRMAFTHARLRRPPKRHKHVGELWGFRCWGLMGDILMPITRPMDYVSWAGPVARTKIEPGSTGFWSVKIDPNHSKNLFRVYDPPVFGFVELGGRIIEFEKGYHSEICTIRGLIVVPPVGDAVLKSMEDRYQCNVQRKKGSQ